MTKDTTRLTDFIPPVTLQRILDSFTAVTGIGAEIRDGDDELIARSQSAGDADVVLTSDDDRRRQPMAPVEVNGRRLATMALSAVMAPAVLAAPVTQRSGLDGDGEAMRQAEAVRLLYLFADTLGQMCRQGMQLRRRVDELTMLFELSTLLAGESRLERVLDTICRSLVELLAVKAAAIRMLSSDGETLVTQAVCNLSPQYLSKGPILLSRSLLDQVALRGEMVYVQNMATDPRVLYPEDAAREGLASILSVGMVYGGKPVGVLRVYTAEPYEFRESERNLLRAVGQLAAGAVRNAQLIREQEQHERIRQQVQLAAEVQQQLLPQWEPACGPFDVAGRYEPCFELGGDFYDFIPLDGNLGIVVGDVVGKGVAASLLMASVRAALRAHVESIYDIDEVMARVNTALVRDTQDHQFATVLYGTLDCRSMRFTYCSAGHERALLYRKGEFMELGIGGMALGIDASQRYDKGLVDLKAGDVLLVYTDGVTDASNFSGEKFGRQRVREAIVDMADCKARDIVNHVLWQVRRFVGLNYRPDDMTLVAIKVGGSC